MALKRSNSRFNTYRRGETITTQLNSTLDNFYSKEKTKIHKTPQANYTYGQLQLSCFRALEKHMISCLLRNLK